MIRSKAIIGKFARKAEKSGWTYLPIPAVLAEKIRPGCRQSFRVKGRLDQVPLEQVALLPMGGGDFILPLNAALRKALGKSTGDEVDMQLSADESEYVLNPGLMECLADEPAALAFFNSKPPSYQRYYSKWIDSAKTGSTRTRRIALAVNALAAGMEFGEMLRKERAQKLR